MLEILNVSKTFNKGTINEKKALNKLSLHLNPGDFVTIIGGNGAGKSTMLNMIAGVYPIDGGRIIIDGVDISRMPEYKRAKYIGRVFQDPMMGTSAGMQIDENLALAFRRGESRGLAWGIKKSEKEKYKEILSKLDLGLQTRMTSKVGLLSGGQILDLTEQVVAEQNLTAMMVTHNMKDALNIGNRLIMMHSGRVIYDVSGEEKKKLKVDDLLRKFEEASGGEFANDRMMLAN